MQATKPSKSKLGHRKYLKWFIAALLILLLAFFIYKKLNPTPVAPTYLTGEVQRQDIENTVMASGKIKAIETVNVGSQVSGEITRLYVDVGDFVKKGDIIAQISQVEQKNLAANAKATLEQAEANLSQAQGDLAARQGEVAQAAATVETRQAELNRARQSFQRLQGLIEINAISREEYDEAQSKVAVAEAALKTAQASHQNALTAINNAKAAIKSQQAAIGKARNDVITAEESLSHTTIRAPMDGTVVSVTQKQGTTVNANQSAPTIVTLADLSRVRINAQISEADVINIRPDMPARFNIIGNPDEQYNAILKGIEPAPETISSTSSTSSAVYYIGYLDVDNSDGRFRIDMTAQVNIIIDQAKNALVIPASAIKTDKGKTTVQIIGKDGFAEAVEVKVGINNRVNAQILSGLQQGQTIVIGESGEGGDERGSSNRGRSPMMR
ncbi:efflux RND transporter periplasmic adaptor subunit [Moraxella cuniculi]|uniref:Macrolide-specific efflux protein macA n=1 Tax=Moraxella cuniculi TaxID=34061 RepID=A0A3S4ULZ9_9GAMM|nr:efflux RND transporter periplasmic adaptor subunit [Moraxella cuniculi]VEG13880.1 Macrolide-specific efflux protein macA precursor [Moraxella cuniculi]